MSVTGRLFSGLPLNNSHFSSYFSEIPVIPDLDDFQEEDLANKIAAPPRFVNSL
jgi:hypothetical protein